MQAALADLQKIGIADIPLATQQSSLGNGATSGQTHSENASNNSSTSSMNSFQTTAQQHHQLLIRATAHAMLAKSPLPATPAFLHLAENVISHASLPNAGAALFNLFHEVHRENGTVHQTSTSAATSLSNGARNQSLSALTTINTLNPLNTPSPHNAVSQPEQPNISTTSTPTGLSPHPSSGSSSSPTQLPLTTTLLEWLDHISHRQQAVTGSPSWTRQGGF